MWQLFQLTIILKNFSIHLIHFHLRRQSLVKKIDLVKHSSLINFRACIITQGMAKFQAMLQRKQPTKAVLKKVVPGHFASWKNCRVLIDEKVSVSWKKGPVLQENYFFELQEKDSQLGARTSIFQNISRWLLLL